MSDRIEDERPWEAAEHQAECPLCGGVVDIWFEGFRFDDRYTLVREVDSNCGACPFTYHGSIPVDKEGGFVALLTAEERAEERDTDE